MDLPPAASAALAKALLVPCGGDLGGLLETCEAVRDLLDRWQDAFFAALPADIDLVEEARWASDSGVSLAEIEAQWGDDDDDPGDLDEGAWGEVDEHGDHEDASLDITVAPLDDDLVVEMETALLLLPFRVRLEALIAAGNLVDEWSDLLGDHEKCLGHLVLQHHVTPSDLTHPALADQHAALHAGRAAHASCDE